MYTTVIVMLAAIAAMVSAQDLTLVNIIQFSDDYCLCPNEQHISVVDLCVPVIGGYSVYRLVDGTPDQVIIQTCSDNQCTQCTNTTTYNARPPCQTETDGIAYYSVLPENDPTTYFNAPSVVTVRFPYKNCSGDALHVDIAYGLSCFPTQEGGSFYYECPAGVTSEYYVYNCSDNACLEDCTPSTFPTEQCSNDEGVFKSVYCTPSTSSTSQTSTSNDNTATSNDNTATSSDNTATGQTMGSATVSTTTSASSHNVSSSASAANNGGTSASSATSGGSSVIFSNDNRGGQMHRKAPRSNPPFCNGGVPSSSSAAAASTAANSISTGANTANDGTASTSGGSGGSSGGSSGGRGAKIFMTKN